MERFIPFYSDDSDDIYRKKEFYEERLLTELGREFSTSNPNLLKYQELISRLAGQYTQFNNLLLFHEMGSGKTRSAIATVELARKQSITPLKKTLVLLKNKALINKFIRELVVKAEPEQYDTDLSDPLTRVTVKKVRKNYEITTFISFANLLEKDMAKQVEQYSHSIVIIDEVQQLVGERGGNDPYSLIHKFLHTIQDSKVLLMSGTPMKDTPDQFAMVMNLILNSDEQLPTGKEFMKKYFKGLYLTDKGKDKLKGMIRNKISYLSPPSNVKTKFMGRGLPDSQVRFLKVVEDRMSEFQNSVYSTVANSDATGDFNRPDRYASDFVFPDRTFGKGVTTFVSGEGNKLRLKEKFRNHLLGDTDEETLKNLRKYSCKYASIIKSILDAPEELVFVYSEYVQQGGVILFSLLLQDLFGFEVTGSVKKSEKKRCTLITGDVEPHRVTELLEDMINKPENMTGKICRVVIGSRAIAIGHDMKNVRQVHIATPHWNFSETDQIIARAKRFDGNKALEEAGLNPTLRVFLHAAVSPTTQSIDMRLWGIAEKKDFILKQIDRISKESAIDCGFNYKVNYHYQSGDGSRDCNYEECLYYCDDLGIPKNLSNDELDATTFKKFYQKENVDRRVKKLEEDLLMRSAANFYPNEPVQLTTKSLVGLYDQSVSFPTRFGLDSYTRTDGAAFFQTDSVDIPVEANIDMNWYSRYPILTQRKSLSQVLQDSPDITERIESTLKVIHYVDTVEETLDMINKLPSWIRDDTIMRVWKDVINNRVKGDLSIQKFKALKGNDAYKRVVLATTKYMKISPKSVTYEDSSNVFWTYARGAKGWVIRTAKEQNEDIQEVIGPYRERAMDDGVGYFGILDKEYTDVNSLKIVEAQNLRSLGRNCGSYTKALLLRLVLQFDIEPLEEIENVSGVKDIVKKNGPLMEAAGDLVKKAKTQQLNNVLWWSKVKNLQQKLCPVLVDKFDEAELLVRA
jgi:hypothetical protein